MAIRTVRRVPFALLIAALGCIALIAPTLAGASPHIAPRVKPTITSVQQRLGRLALQNSQLVEKYNHSRIVLAKRDKAAAAAESAATRARDAYTRAHAAFVRVIQAQYESGSMGAAGALFDSNSGSNYLDRLDTMNLMSAHSAEVVTSVGQKRSAAAKAADFAHKLQADAQANRDALAKQKRQVAGQIDKYKALLAKLNAAQQAAFEARQNGPHIAKSEYKTDNLPRASSKQAQIAVAFALKQVGKPYVYATAGPGSYDCSGLTMASWAAAGISLPHSAADQYNYGHHVSRDQLEPGDLIFFYQPIGHVTIYIGNGMMVSAPTEGEPVAVVPLAYFDNSYVGATRL